jgi:hypothetical protein
VTVGVGDLRGPPGADELRRPDDVHHPDVELRGLRRELVDVVLPGRTRFGGRRLDLQRRAEVAVVRLLEFARRGFERRDVNEIYRPGETVATVTAVTTITVTAVATVTVTAVATVTAAAVAATATARDEQAATRCESL